MGPKLKRVAGRGIPAERNPTCQVKVGRESFCLKLAALKIKMASPLTDCRRFVDSHGQYYNPIDKECRCMPLANFPHPNQQ